MTDAPLIPTADEVLADLGNSLADALTTKQREVVDYLISTGERPARAAEALGITRGYISRLLTLPKVRAYYDAELEALRTSGRARRVHLLEKTVDKAMEPDATAAMMRVGLEVVKHLDGPGEAARGTSVNIAIAIPGYVIDLSDAGTRPTIDLRVSPPNPEGGDDR
ncbi:MAG: hypothetical protein K2X45_04915 [Phreatobacter sp.]|nr:hypothetical protein [Phreatobacter sp.]